MGIYHSGAKYSITPHPLFHLGLWICCCSWDLFQISRMGLGTLCVCPVWMMGQPKSWSAFKIQGCFLVSFCQCLFWPEAQFGEDLGDRKATWYKVHLSPRMRSEQPFRSWLTPHTSISVQGKLSLNVPFLVASIWNNFVFLSRNVTPHSSLLRTPPNQVVINHLRWGF